MDLLERFLNFAEQSPTAFHAVQNICDALAAAGWRRLEERERWEIAPGGRYYLTRNRSSGIAFRVPEPGFAHFQIVASHSDSPVFKIKENAELEVKNSYIQLDTERYGGA